MEEKKKKSILKNPFFDIIAIILWLYMFIKLFVFDLDNYLFQTKIPQLSFLLTYKFFIIIFIFSLGLIFLKKSIFKIIGFIIIYPLIFLLWRIPRAFWKRKSWIGVFTSIGILASFIQSFKVNFIIFTFLSISILFITISNNFYVLVFSNSVLLIYLLYHFSKHIYYSVKPSHIFEIQSKAITSFWEKSQNHFKVEPDINISQLAKLPSEKADKFYTNLSVLMAYNKMCYFITSKMRLFQRSKMTSFIYIGNLIFTLSITVIIFGIFNFSLYKFDPSNFNTYNNAKFIHFVYYSFNTILSNNINDFFPVSSFARLLNSLELLFGFILLIILVFLLTTIQRDKHNEELDRAINTIKKQGNALEKFVDTEYKLKPEQALLLVQQVKSEFYKIILYFIRNIEEEQI